jgi:hypothetical protein
MSTLPPFQKLDDTGATSAGYSRDCEKRLDDGHGRLRVIGGVELLDRKRCSGVTFRALT